MFKDLLFQVVVILVPVLVYFSLIKPNGYQLSENKKKLMIILFSSISVILCLSSPVSLADGTILDLRSIPWLLSFFYGGHIAGIIVTIVLIIFRFFVSVSTGAFITFFSHLISALILIRLFRNTEDKLQKKKQNILIMGLITSLLLVIKIHIFVFNFSTTNEKLAFLIFFVVVNLIVLYVIVSLIEILEERNSLFEQMQLKEKQYIVGQLAASVAHEIRNPMTVISGFVQLIDQAKETPEPHRKYTKLMLIELDRAEKIIKDYLSLGKQEIGKLEQIDVTKELEKVKETLQRYALLHNINISVSILYTEENVFVYGDKHKFMQVLINMIKNAIEASEERGEVNVLCSCNYDTVKIEIKDYGKGMTEHQLKNLGVPFYSMKEKGTGLGLMVCYNIIEAMKGKIEVESELGVGTNFKITLPKIND